jgi:hypothetical protein
MEAFRHIVALQSCWVKPLFQRFSLSTMPKATSRDAGVVQQVLRFRSVFGPKLRENLQSAVAAPQ